MFLQIIRIRISEWMHSDIVRQFATNSLWMIIARGLWILSAFTVGILTARELGPRNFGILNHAVAYVGMFSVIANLGVDSLVSRDYILHPERRERILGNFFLFKLITTVIMLLCVSAAIFLIHDKQSILFCFILTAGYVFTPLQSVNIVFPALVKNEYSAYSSIIICLLYSGIRLWAILTGQPLIVYVAAETLLTGGSTLLLFFFYCLKCGNPLHWTWSWKESLSLIIPAIPLSITVILSTLYARTDILMLDYYMGSVSVGHYSVATKFTENVNLILGIFGGIFSVVVVNAKKVSAKEYRKQFHRYLFMMFYMTFPMIFAGFLLGRPLILWLYGQAYISSVDVFYISILTAISYAILCCIYFHEINFNRLKLVAFINFSGALLNVPLNAWLIQRMGTVGAAWSSLISMPVGFIITMLCTRQGRHDLKFIGFALTHLPTARLNEKLQE